MFLMLYDDLTGPAIRFQSADSELRSMLKLSRHIERYTID